MNAVQFHPFARGLLAAVLAIAAASDAGAEPTTLDYRVTGVQLEVSPAILSVPKNIAGSLHVRLSTGADGISGDVAWVEGTLRGPSFAARRVAGWPKRLLKNVAQASLPVRPAGFQPAVEGEPQPGRLRAAQSGRLRHVFQQTPNEPLLLPPVDVARLSKVECPAHVLDFGKSGYIRLRRATASFLQAKCDFESTGLPAAGGSGRVMAEPYPPVQGPCLHATSYRSAVAQCAGDARAALSFPAGEGGGSRHYRGSATPGYSWENRSAVQECDHARRRHLNPPFSTTVHFVLP